MSLRWTRFRNGFATATAPFSAFAAAWLCGLGQIFFSGAVAGGLLVLIAAAALSPWAALWGALGGLIGTAIGRFAGVHDAAAWRAGLAGYNLAIVGAIVSGAGYEGIAAAPAIAAAVILCLALEYSLTKAAQRRNMPILSSPAIVAVTVVSLIWAGTSAWYWVDPPALQIGRWGLAIAGIAIVAALSLVSTGATLQAMALAGLAAWLAIALGYDLSAATGLWVFAAGLSSFGIQTVFVPGRLAGACFGVLAAILGSALWTIWQLSALASLLPPTLIPFLLAVWITLWVWRATFGWYGWQDSYWRALGAIRRALRTGAAVAVLRDDENWDPDKPSAAHRSWLPGVHPVEAFSFANLAALPDNRRVLWQAASDLVRNLERRKPDGDADHADDDWANIILGRTTLAGAPGAQVALNGHPDRTRCLGCRAAAEVPPPQVWRRFDVRCQACGEPIVPDLTIDDQDWTPERLAPLDSPPPHSVLVLAEGGAARSRAGENLKVWARARGMTVIQQVRPQSAPPVNLPDIQIQATDFAIPRVLLLPRGPGWWRSDGTAGETPAADSRGSNHG